MSNISEVITQPMKCPHCNTAIYESFATNEVIRYHPVNSRTGERLAPATAWLLVHQRCPQCHEAIIYLQSHNIPLGANPNVPAAGYPPVQHFLAYPRSGSRPIPSEVPSPYRDDFSEACKVLADSPKASAALSRRCLQAILRDFAKTKARDLVEQIEEIINSGTAPPNIQGELNAVRVIGNFAAHPTKSTATGEIIDVEPEEANWNLEVLESLFAFYFVQPDLTAKRKAALNSKLKAAGKPELA